MIARASRALMRVRERPHKRGLEHRDDQRVVVAVDAGSRTMLCTSGTICMSTISAHKPIAVSMVAGRVCRCGVGSRRVRWSVIDQSFEKSLPKKVRPKPENRMDPAVTNLGHGNLDLNKNLFHTMV
jgi:hypothetical protein